MKAPGPRFIPLLLIVAGGALALRALAGAEALPQMFEGAKALAEEIAPTAKGHADKAVLKGGKGGDQVQALLKDAPPMSPTAVINPAPPPAAPVCAPTPAELAKQAGMSPAELQVLQSLGTRRTQLDAREQGLSTQLQLLAAAEMKVDAKLKQLTGIKGDIQGLLTQASAQKQTEITRLITVYEGMKPQEAAQRISLLDDSVRLPMAAKMSVRKLSAILAQMSPAEAKSLTEKLADRLAAADRAREALTQAADASAAMDATAAPDPTAPAPAAKAAKGKAPAKPAPKAKAAQAAAAPAADPPAAAAKQS